MKCEPAAYTIDDLARDGVTGWEGVRNYQARNTMRDDMKPGDGVLFYASNAEPSGVVGLAEIAREGYPDPFAFKKGHRYFDEKSTKDEPTWYTVDVRFIEKFADVVALGELREQRSLAQMVVLQKGSRLSIQPVTKAQYDAVVKLGRAKAAASLRGRAGRSWPARRTTRRGRAWRAGARAAPTGRRGSGTAGAAPTAGCRSRP